MFSGRIRRGPHAGSAPLVPTTALTLAVGLALGLALLAGCGSDTKPGVELGQVSLATVTEVVEAPATVVARASATVTAPAAGTVAELKVADGQRVTRGQVLLRIDSPSTRKALDSARAADAQAAGTGSVSVPRIDLTTLRRSDAAADQAFAEARTAATAIPDPKLRARALAQVLAAQADYRAAQAEVRRLGTQVNSGLAGLGRLTSSLSEAQRAQTRAAVAAAQSSVDALTVRAPVNGTVVLGATGSGSAAGSAGDLSAALGQLQSGSGGGAASALGSAAAAGASTSGGTPSAVGALEVGTPVTAGSPLLTITDVSTLSLTASVDETDVLLVKRGVTADVELDAVPGATYPATVRSVDLQPTASARGGVSYVVRLTPAAGRDESGTAAPTPRPGMSAVARLKVRTAADAVSVPAAAVFRDGARDAVWVVDGGAARRHTVQLGAQGDAVVQVTSGLEVGQSVVVKGADQVTEGQRVDAR